MPNAAESADIRAGNGLSYAASGVDFEAASEIGIQVIWALSLPGKTAPVSAGKIVAQTVEELLAAEDGDVDE